MVYCFNVKTMNILNKQIKDALNKCSFIFDSYDKKYYILTLNYDEK